MDILDGGDLIIQGNGAANTIIDGGGIDRVFHICPSGGCTNTVTFEDVTIQHGNPGSADGGGILNAGGMTTVDSSTVISNTARYGGGIYNDATLIIQNDSEIGGVGAANQAATWGGGIFNDTNGATTVTSSTISANTAIYGGGIFNEATLIIQNGSTIGEIGVGNQATSLGGGGIYNHDGTTTVDASTVSGNSAGFGGGVCNLSTLIIQNGSTIGGNTTTSDGGGIHNSDTLTITNSTIGGASVDNQATNYGGGIYNWGGGITTMNGGTVISNTAHYGGGIYNDVGTMAVNDSTISNNGSTSTYGGGIYNNVGTTTVDGCTFSRNTAYEAGGIYNKDILTVTNSIIGGIGAGNNVTDYAGGIYNDGGTLMVDGCTISGNTADDGGGIYNYVGTTTVEDSIVISNTATWGGGIYNDGTLHVQNGSIIGKAGFGNQATDEGGGIYHYDGTTTVDDSTISDNKAGYGGGIYLESYGAVTVTVSRITHNTAITNGGSVFNNVNVAGAANVTGSCVVGNSDTSFFNNRTAQLTATGNWWGAASGPSGVGPGEGDSVSVNVDYGSFLTVPPSICNYYVYLPLVVKE